MHEKVSMGLNPVTMISVIGGNLGLWLGISFLQIASKVPTTKLLCLIFRKEKQ